MRFLRIRMATFFLAAVSSMPLLQADTGTNSPPPPGALNYIEGRASIGALALDSKSVGSTELARGRADNNYRSSQTGRGDETRIRGCLSGSPGNYILTDEPGHTYRLEGSTSKLHGLLGSEVWIRGTETEAPANSPVEKQINVKRVMKLFDTCSLPGVGR